MDTTIIMEPKRCLNLEYIQRLNRAWLHDDAAVTVLETIIIILGDVQECNEVSILNFYISVLTAPMVEATFVLRPLM